MADLGIAEIRAEGRKMLAKYRNSDGDSTDEAKAIELWFWGWVDELLRDPEGIDEDGTRDALCEALRIAVEELQEIAWDHDPMPVTDGRDWCSKCQNYMRGDSGCTAADAAAALAAVRELVDLGEGTTDVE